MKEKQPPRLGYRVGKHEFSTGLGLAPMAGNTNLAYRRLCRKFGAELTTTEMVSARALEFADEKSLTLLERGEEENPVAAQVFGATPSSLGKAAAAIQERGFHIVDLNIGCPVPKITGGGGGSALLREPKLAEECVFAMVEACDIPVTVKIRAGWDDGHKNAPEFAQVMEQAGAQAITVHGRTREQKYTGRSDLDLINQVTQAVHIPVIGNGDVIDVNSASRMAQTGVQGIAIGRGALGSPWLFSQVKAWAKGEDIPSPPPTSIRAALLLELGEGVVGIYGEHRGMLMMRRLSADFFRGVPGAPKLRDACKSLNCLADLRILADRLAQAPNYSGREPSQANP